MTPSDPGNLFGWAQDGIRQAHLRARALNKLVQAELRGERRQESAENQPLTAFSALLRLRLLLLWLPLLLLASALPSAEFFALHCLSASLCPSPFLQRCLFGLTLGLSGPNTVASLFGCPSSCSPDSSAPSRLWRCTCSTRGLSAPTRLLSSTSCVCSTHRCPNTFFLSSSSPRFSTHSSVFLVSSASRSSCASTFCGFSYSSCALLPSFFALFSLPSLLALFTFSPFLFLLFFCRFLLSLSLCFPLLSRAPSSLPLPTACHCFAASSPCWHSSQPSTSRPFFLFWLLLDTICPFHDRARFRHPLNNLKIALPLSLRCCSSSVASSTSSSSSGSDVTRSSSSCFSSSSSSSATIIVF